MQMLRHTKTLGIIQVDDAVWKRLSADEKKLLQNYRKCNLIEKKLIETITEKAAGGIDLSSLIGLLK